MTKGRGNVSRQFSTLTQQTKEDFDQERNGCETCWVDAGGENYNSRMQIWSYRNSKPKLLLTYALSILTCGLVRLIFHWKPTWRIALTCYGCSLKEAELILIRDENFEYFLREVKFGGQTNVDGLSFFGPNGEIYDQEYYRYFNHRKISYVWYGERYRFRRLMNADHKVHCGEYHKFLPLTDKQADRRFVVYGPNEILVKLKPIVHLVFLEQHREESTSEFLSWLQTLQADCKYDNFISDTDLAYMLALNCYLRDTQEWLFSLHAATLDLYVNIM
uniref:Cation-transporting ATPase n=1 Tax=Romanomermis culicivorax TaxID=13658 RepID=A0A915JP68_ROMCU